ncbi:hypothetical protein [Sutterella wadsworthensis]|nr:hypothetical protein [Sutterella wadsworthensis]
MRAHPKGKTLVRKAGRPGGREALQTPGETKGAGAGEKRWA